MVVYEYLRVIYSKIIILFETGLDWVEWKHKLPFPSKKKIALKIILISKNFIKSDISSLKSYS